MSLHRDELLVHLPIGVKLVLVLRKGVQNSQMLCRVGQTLAVVLAMNVDQSGGDIPQDGYSGGHSVDTAMTFALGGDFTVNQKLFASVVTGLFQLHFYLFGQLVEGCPDTGFRCTGTHQVTADPVAQNSTDGVDQNRLTRAGLTGQNVQTGSKLYLYLFDHGHIFNS